MPAFIGIALAVLGGALAQLLMKSGLHSVTLSDLPSVFYSVQHEPVASFMILTGIVFYVAAMVIWVYTLKNIQLSKAYPLLSLGYVVVYLAAAFWPNVLEPYTAQKSLGIGLILFGVWYSQREPVSGENA